ncbi:inorganic pyrophosphatase [Chloroflexota bacterium]
MNALNTGSDFWRQLDQLVATSTIVIDRPAGTAHPHYPEFVYSLDYGYLAGTTAIDGGGVDVWRGSLPDQVVVGVVCTLDLTKRDMEVKILLGCTPAEMQTILAVHNQHTMAGLLLPRPGLD